MAMAFATTTKCSRCINDSACNYNPNTNLPMKALVFTLNELLPTALLFSTTDICGRMKSPELPIRLPATTRAWPPTDREAVQNAAVPRRYCLEPLGIPAASPGTWSNHLPLPLYCRQQRLPCLGRVQGWLTSSQINMAWEGQLGSDNLLLAGVGVSQGFIHACPADTRRLLPSMVSSVSAALLHWHRAGPRSGQEGWQ